MTDLFKFHKLNEKWQELAKLIAADFKRLLESLSYIPEGRELSMVTIKLEEACFFAKKGMAMQKENQE